MSDYETARRAVAMCLASEPHCDVKPCDRHWFAARRSIDLARQLSASALASATGPAPGALANGAAGRCPSVGGSSLNDNRPVREHRAAEGATVIARNESMA